MQIYHNKIIVEYSVYDKYALYWADDKGNSKEYICGVYGFENAIRVANGIAHEQVEFVQSPPFKSDYETDRELQEAYGKPWA